VRSKRTAHCVEMIPCSTRHCGCRGFVPNACRSFERSKHKPPGLPSEGEGPYHSVLPAAHTRAHEARMIDASLLIARHPRHAVFLNCIGKGPTALLNADRRHVRNAESRRPLVTEHASGGGVLHSDATCPAAAITS
jgi:hypothetical protein